MRESHQLLSGLSVEVRTSTEFSGSFSSDSGVVTFYASWVDTKVSGNINTGSVDINILADTAAGAEAKGVIQWNVTPGLIGESDHSMLNEMHSALAELVPYGEPYNGDHPDQATPVEGLIRNWAGFFAEGPARLSENGWDSYGGQVAYMQPQDTDKIPDGHSSPPPTCTINPSDDDGIVMLWDCCWSNPVKPWDHDRTDSCLMLNSNKCGFHGDLATPCAGRCGAGCKSAPFYFQDCLDHDFCVDIEGGLSYDPNNTHCGDEWWEASDDFASIYVATFGPVLFGNVAHPLFLYAVCE